jgi:hypothetical protein
VSKPLTAAQERILRDARLGRTRPYNGIARRPIEALEALGLVEVDWDMTPHADAHGNIGSLSWRISITAVRQEHPDRLGNFIRREGCDRCWCGCKYWENDTCVDCGGKEVRKDEN